MKLFWCSTRLCKSDDNSDCSPIATQVAVIAAKDTITAQQIFKKIKMEGWCNPETSEIEVKNLGGEYFGTEGNLITYCHLEK